MSDTLTATIDATGIHAPEFAAVLDGLIAQFHAIYGEDAYLQPDSQDGQWLAVMAAAMNDTISMAVAVYNAFSPATAQGAGLSSVVKINGIARTSPTYSTVDVKLVGQAGASIVYGVVTDPQNNRWGLAPLVVVPPEGEITVTAIAAALGAIAIGPGSATIATPALGWQSAEFVSSSSPGEAVETDAELRIRQAASTAIPSQTVLEGLLGAIAAIPGVIRYAAYENDTATTNAEGIPSHSISLVVEGGDTAEIGQAIALRKAPGVGTYGTTSEVVTDRYGIPRTYRFYRPTMVTISVAITLDALIGYTSVIGEAVRASIAAYLTALPIGARVMLTRLYVPANLGGGAGSATFEVIALAVSRSPASPAPADVALAFNEAAVCAVSDVTLTVV